jgi:hypothetical protein
MVTLARHLFVAWPSGQLSSHRRSNTTSRSWKYQGIFDTRSTILNDHKIHKGRISEVRQVAWVTTLGPAMAQIDYRLEQQSGCSLTAGDDGQVAYRLESDRPLEWVGDGLREVGIEPGTVLDDDGKKAARALADGRDPSTGDVLVAPKMAVDPLAKLPAGPLVAAVRAAAERAGTTPAGLLDEPRAAARYGRLQRGVAREQTRTDGPEETRPDAERVVHRAPVADLERVAAAAGVRLDDLYDADGLAVAREHAGARVVVGNRGYDLTLDLPKSYSVLTAMADPELAGELEDVYLDADRGAAVGRLRDARASRRRPAG